MADFMQMIDVSAAGMYAQTERMKIASENVANADSTQSADGSGPYRAHQVYFKSVLDRHTGMTSVQVQKVANDMTTPLKKDYQPGNPLADAKGFVAMPNVDPLMENVNMKEAQRSYEANLGAIQTAKDMMSQTLSILR